MAMIALAFGLTAAQALNAPALTNWTLHTGFDASCARKDAKKSTVKTAVRFSRHARNLRLWPRQARKFAPPLS